MRRLIALMGLLVIAGPTAAAAPPQAPASLTVEHNAFRLVVAPDRVLSSVDMVGAVLQATGEDGAPLTVRIDSVSPSKERPGTLLHSFSQKDPATGQWTPLCEADAGGRRAGLAIAGRWDGQGRFVKDAKAWYPACTSGAQGKCILWGYDPWDRGPHGEDLAPFYQACTHLVRADYDGRGAANTRDGTAIDLWDVAGVQTPETLNDPQFAFEAGWGPDGAVCVARTRYADLLPLRVLLESAPRLGGTCSEAEAKKRGALIFNRSR